MGILGGPMDTISFEKGNALETRVLKNGELMFISARVRTGKLKNMIGICLSEMKANTLIFRSEHNDPLSGTCWFQEENHIGLQQSGLSNSLLQLLIHFVIVITNIYTNNCGLNNEKT